MYGARKIHNNSQYLSGCQGKEGSDLFHMVSTIAGGLMCESKWDRAGLSTKE